MKRRLGIFAVAFLCVLLGHAIGFYRGEQRALDAIIERLDACGVPHTVEPAKPLPRLPTYRPGERR